MPSRLGLPSSSAFWILSSGYRDAGDSTLDKIRSSEYVGFAVMPCVFLFFRSIELALKVVLVHHTVSEHEITRVLGHKISALLSRVESFTALSSIGIGSEDKVLLDRFSDDYAYKSFEYSDDWWQNPNLENLQSLAHRVSDAVRFYGRTRPSDMS